MHYWKSVLDEVLHKDNHAHTFFYTNQGRMDEVCLDNHTQTHHMRDHRMYYLGSEFPELYLTKREAETMFWVVQDYTLAYVGEKMNLSSRTIEFYVKNLKLKLQCKTKKALIEKVLQTNLLQQLEKEGMRIVKHG